MSLQSIRNLNLFATLAAGYIGLTSSVHAESIFLMELKECSRRIYAVPKFVFYALGYAIERVLSMSRKGINSFFPPKDKSQQLNLFENFKIEDSGTFVFKKRGNSKEIFSCNHNNNMLIYTCVNTLGIIFTASLRNCSEITCDKVIGKVIAMSLISTVPLFRHIAIFHISTIK